MKFELSFFFKFNPTNVEYYIIDILGMNEILL